MIKLLSRKRYKNTLALSKLANYPSLPFNTKIDTKYK